MIPVKPITAWAQAEEGITINSLFAEVIDVLDPSKSGAFSQNVEKLLPERVRDTVRLSSEVENRIVFGSGEVRERTGEKEARPTKDCTLWSCCVTDRCGSGTGRVVHRHGKKRRCGETANVQTQSDAIRTKFIPVNSGVQTVKPTSCAALVRENIY